MAKRGRPRYPDILTPREWEVLALLRQGLSNEEIAARLTITERTAKYHVSEILGKLGVATRQEAAAWEPGERRPWWAVAGAPLLFWRKLSLGWLPTAVAGAVVVVVAAGLGLLAWGLVRTGGDGDSAASVLVVPTVTPEPPDELVWESEDGSGSFRMVSVHPASCGDATTAEAYGVPMMLEFTRQGPLSSHLLLGLEAEPYEYVPAQIHVWGPYAVSPDGWELSQRPLLLRSVRPGFVLPEFFVRRLDQATRLFRYSADLCNQEDGSPAQPDPRPGRTIELPRELPRVVMHREGDYLSAQEAIDIAMRTQQRGGRAVWAELGNSADFAATRGERDFPPLIADPEQVIWVVLLAMGDQSGPQRPDHELGSYTTIDASTGEAFGWGCCLDLVTGP